MRVSILQPTYWARTHVWNRMFNSDVFIWLDSVQFSRSKTKWEDRTVIESSDGRSIVLRLPLAGSKHVRWVDARLNEKWERHATSIRQCYSRRPYWSVVEEMLPLVYLRPASTIEEVCWRTYAAVARVLKPVCSVIRASELRISSKKGDLIYDLVEAVGGTEYLTGAPGAEYLPVERFANAGIAVKVQRWAAPQTAGGLRNPSVLHVLAMLGPDEARELIAAPSAPIGPPHGFGERSHC